MNIILDLENYILEWITGDCKIKKYSIDFNDLINV